MSAYFQAQLERQGYTIVQPLTKETSSVSGNDLYVGTVAYGINNMEVRFEVCKSVYESQQRFKDTVNGAMDSGYNNTISLTADKWEGRAADGTYADVWLDTSNHIVERIW
jgi:hypothetical protein